MFYGSEIRPLLVDVGLKFERATVIRSGRLRWYVYVMRTG